MKKIFEMPTMNVAEFNRENVVTTSSLTDDIEGMEGRTFGAAGTVGDKFKQTDGKIQLTF